MELQMSTPEINPSYNDSVGVGSGELTTALDQYWTERRAAYAENVERLRPLAADTEAERKWHDFCAYRTGFLKKFLKAGAKVSAGPLRELWNWKLGLVREARLAFQKDARVELWIPYQRSPLKFVSIGGKNGPYDFRESSYPTGQEYFELGKAYVTVFFRDIWLFTILPTRAYVTMNNYIYTKDQVTWDTQEVLCPKHSPVNCLISSRNCRMQSVHSLHFARSGMPHRAWPRPMQVFPARALLRMHGAVFTCPSDRSSICCVAPSSLSEEIPPLREGCCSPALQGPAKHW